MLNQKLQQKLLQKLSPQQILLMKLLQIPSMALEQRIKQEIEENPALEEIGELDNPEDKEEEENGEDEDENEIEENKEDEFDLDDYLDDDEIPSYKLSANNRSADDERKEIPFASGTSFHEILMTQLSLRPLNEKQHQIGEYIIGNLDDSGYLHRDITSMIDDLAFTQNIEASEDEIIEVLKVIQDFDPAGVGARNLQECLLLQLKREENGNEDLKNAELILERYFNEFTKKHYDKILKKSEMSQEELKNALEIILKLNPKPGNTMSESARTNHYVIPDFIIYNNNGDLELTLNSRNTPELKLSRSYIDMLETYAHNKKDKRQKDAYMFVKQKIDSAKWFIDAIRQRQNTLYVTMKAIMDYQRDYFMSGDERKLRPMILKDIAEIVGLDISTVSRVANSKYVQTPFGTLLLKSFFSESMQTNDGEEVSTREIKSILTETIELEDKKKPFTDENLTRLLKEKGYNIARRTVAKYREQLNIPVARLRKEL
ncbi:MAG: RNA polymerase factor sigma-54 [Bacteroidales bacterium]|nr:RNA polymerase factor sigma-54 [Bacteroidales bacterium]MCF8399694.1 RNA polymerase factor sigma-54 [Bacteroidales bacterium]